MASHKTRLAVGSDSELMPASVSMAAPVPHFVTFEVGHVIDGL